MSLIIMRAWIIQRNWGFFIFAYATFPRFETKQNCPNFNEYNFFRIALIPPCNIKRKKDDAFTFLHIKFNKLYFVKNGVNIQSVKTAHK